MPWKKTRLIDQRYDFVLQMRQRAGSLNELCKQWGISRKTAYKWLARFQKGKGKALTDKSRRPLCQAAKTNVSWLRRIRSARKKRPTWGARKLRYELLQKHPEKEVPSTATISRWLRKWGLARGRKRRRRGPLILKTGLRVPKCCHEVWTVDFKGWYRTSKGRRVDPLTVRDLYSRYILAIELLPSQALIGTKEAMEQIFKQYGLPECIRCDNGTPFGATAASNLSRLSAWWVKLGIKIDFITPGRPGENGSHEHFHGVYKAEVARKPKPTLRAQQKKSDAWKREYNEERPHESLGMRPPAEFYKPNLRRMNKVKLWKYPPNWSRHWVKANGEISWRGKRRYVGEGFAEDYVGLKPIKEGIWEVYFGPVLVGELHQNESGSIRMARYVRRPESSR